RRSSSRLSRTCPPSLRPADRPPSLSQGAMLYGAPPRKTTPRGAEWPSSDCRRRLRGKWSWTACWSSCTDHLCSQRRHRSRLSPGFLVLPPQITRQNPQLLAVFRHRPARDGDAFFLQLGHEFLIAQRARLVFHVDQVGDHFLHAGVGNGGATLGLV